MVLAWPLGSDIGIAAEVAPAAVAWEPLTYCSPAALVSLGAPVDLSLDSSSASVPDWFVWMESGDEEREL